MASKYKGPAEALALYEALVAANPAVERKGATTPYTSRNGHMFSFLDEAGTMSLRMSDEARAGFMETYETRATERYGRSMNGYAEVPAALLENIDELQPWFDRSHEWIGTLKPKPTRRKAKKAE